MPNPSSRYEIIWAKLKKEGTVKLAVPSSYHLRLKRAVRKRKDFDLGYKVYNDTQNRKAYLQYKSEGNMLEITLVIKVRSDYL